MCNAEVPDVAGPISSQDYIPQSPGCWKLYTEVLAREYGEWKYPPIHRLTVDAYAAQHPTVEPNKKSAQSVIVHLLNIYLFNQRGWSGEKIIQNMKEVLEKNKGQFIWLEPPKTLGHLTIADVCAAKTLEDHNKIVKEWSISVWDAWIDYHEEIVGYLK